MSKRKYLFGETVVKTSKKLKKGYYCKNLTVEQFEELMRIEDSEIEWRDLSSYYKHYCKSDQIVGFDGDCFYFEFSLLKTKNFHEFSYEEFKAMSKNTVAYED